MENAEEILQCLDEFSKLKPKDIPRELEDYLCFVAKTGDPVYQWPLIKCLFREKLINVITDFYESCPSVDIPPCPNVAAFNYDAMKNFILEKLDTFAAAPFTVQRICELLTTPRKEYNRIDKFMRALEKNILVVSTREPGNRKSTENGENVVNGLESEHVSQEMINSDINVEVEMDESSAWQKTETTVPYAVNETNIILEPQTVQATETVQDTYISESKTNDTATCSSSIGTVITSRPIGYIGYTPNITDLIIEPSNITTAESETVATPAENGESTTENPNMNMFTMNAEPVLATEPPEELKDEERVPYVKTVEQVESVFVKADCSESSYSSVVRLERDQQLMHIETLVKKDEQILQIAPVVSEPETSEIPIEPEQSVSQIEESATESQTNTAQIETTVEQPETTTTVAEPESSNVQLEPESSFEHTNDTESVSNVQNENTNETTITSTDELSANSSDSKQSSTMIVPEAVETSSEDQVSESHLAAEFTVSQTNPSDEQNTEAAHAIEVTNSDQNEESMEVDEVPSETPNTTEIDNSTMESN